ncbi:MAG: DNA polymerase III subunit epsilon [Parcubacteria group bacterium Gr01-1014_48]|nr:MAG: DNA polymerase III subunit epsilon [Parcubacteria group bacterium Greene0416_14]TSC74205.1 MAG: DNA polymerase III subunit epsilon [Parcubacteria group bacterium Gr01-1014_48]TSD01709.1 MAG: DNA polymerase III subunit epsilon [Parcubacteria group bacterium Greene1014_15]TSD08157.1 MAG: DNA polymerase III subunit epsilon [Parcubacteria group bacterium Greene0714_4]
MIVVDVEASGVNPYKHSLVSVGAVHFENPSYQFYEECRIWDGADIMDDAMAVNGFTREQIMDMSKQTDESLVQAFLAWMEKIPERTIVGHNPSFDRDFLAVTAARYHIDWPLAFRTIDTHTIGYMHHLLHGIPPPTENKRSALDLDAILKYVGLPEEPMPHNALTGAKVETEAFSRLIYNKQLLDEFKQYPIPW